MNNDHLSITFQALADPTRRAMLTQLSNGSANVSDLAKPFMKEMSLPAITKHLKVLENAGLIQKKRDAQWRTCTINAKPLQEATDWMEQYRNFWEASFDRLDQYLKKIQSKKSTQKKTKRKKHETK
jgi:DNA-binding transcriptional ArsR family regulator